MNWIRSYNCLEKYKDSIQIIFNIGFNNTNPPDSISCILNKVNNGFKFNFYNEKDYNIFLNYFLNVINNANSITNNERFVGHIQEAKGGTPQVIQGNVSLNYTTDEDFMSPKSSIFTSQSASNIDYILDYQHHAITILNKNQINKLCKSIEINNNNFKNFVSQPIKETPNYTKDPWFASAVKWLTNTGDFRRNKGGKTKKPRRHSNKKRKTKRRAHR
jgi:hypothetical protein